MNNILKCDNCRNSTKFTRLLTMSVFNMESINDTNLTLDIDQDALVIKQYEFIATKINFIMMFIGILSNAICIGILAQKELIKRKFNWYLLILASAELIFCIVLFIDYLFPLIYKEPILLHRLNYHFQIFIYFIIHFTDSYSVAITLLLSIDRLYAIRHPIRIKNFITNKNSKFLLISIFIVFISIKCPQVIISYLMEYHDYDASSSLFFVVYSTIVSPLVMNILPGLSILIINTILFVKIINYEKEKLKAKFNVTIKFSKRSSKRQQQKDEKQHHEHNYKSDYQRQEEAKYQQKNNFTFASVTHRPITRIQKSHYLVIIMLAVWLLFTTIPYYILLCLMGLFHNKTEFKKIQTISSVLFNSNHCINIFIYFCFHSDFRSRIISCITDRFITPKSLMYVDSLKKLNSRRNSVEQDISVKTPLNNCKKSKAKTDIVEI